MELIDKATVVAEIKRIRTYYENLQMIKQVYNGHIDNCDDLLDFLDTLEVIDPYEQCVQYPSIKAGIEAFAETYSFNIDSLLFHQLNKEQQELWRKEIERAAINGGEAGVELARDIRYKENLEVKEEDLEKEIDNIWNPRFNPGWNEKSLLSMNHEGFTTIAKHFFELGLKVQKGE